MSDTTPRELRLAAMNALARREHSRAELASKLVARHGADGAMVAEVLDQLAEEGLQSDARFAEAYARARVNRGYGRLHILNALKKKGVDDACACAALTELEVDWPELASQALVRKFGAEPPDDFREKARRIRFLQYRGFGGDDVREALEALDAEAAGR